MKVIQQQQPGPAWAERGWVAGVVVQTRFRLERMHWGPLKTDTRRTHPVTPFGGGRAEVQDVGTRLVWVVCDSGDAGDGREGRGRAMMLWGKKESQLNSK